MLNSESQLIILNYFSTKLSPEDNNNTDIAIAELDLSKLSKILDIISHIKIT